MGSLVVCLYVCISVTSPSLSNGLNLQKLDNILLRGVYAVHLILSETEGVLEGVLEGSRRGSWRGSWRGLGGGLGEVF